jgi:hypothetical protein
MAMDEIAADAGPQTPIGQVQGDSFCAHCNYNLFSQIILRDERLKIAVCRCPECGGFTAGAALGMAATRAQHRIAVGQIVIYVLFLLAFFSIGSAVLCGLQADVVSDAAYREFGWWWPFVWAGFLAGLGGVSVAAFLWHIRRRFQIICVVVPVLLAMLIWSANNWVSLPATAQQTAAQQALAEVTAVQVLAMAVGVFAGRIITRGILTLLLPLGLRRYLNFLWLVDGKTPPGATAAPVSPHAPATTPPIG